MCADYAESDRNWRTIGTVVGVAKEIDASPGQVTLNWLGNRPGVTAPIFGARTMEQLTESLMAADLALNEEATAILDVVSAPISGGYPNAAFGSGPRARWMRHGTPAPGQPYLGGSTHPLGHL